LAEINVGDLLQQQRLYTGLFVSYAVIVAGFGTAVYLLARRLGAYREREAAQQRLVQLGEAARTLSHEIKNPLGAIRMQQAILARRLPAEHAGSLAVIAEETERIAVLTDRVREFLKDPKGSPEPVDVTAAVRALAHRMDHTITVDAPQTPVVIQFDPGRLRSVLENVLRNAVDASPESQAVTVTLSVRHGRALLAVFDRGAGIATELRERVFDPFFTTKDRGSGVGLAIVRSFVQAAGGTVRIVDASAGGTVVQLTFPTLQSHQEPTDADSRS
jgi:two-component system sensor histidine kinase HydH